MAWLSYSSLIPPNLFILLAMIGVVTAWHKKRLGLAVATAAITCLYLVSMPILATLLMRSAEAMVDSIAPPTSNSLSGAIPPGAIPPGAIPPGAIPPGAIIVLSADARHSDIPGEPDRVGPLTLERLAEAARLHRRLGLPILVSGGSPGHRGISLAALMSETLQQDFGIPVRWREDRSQNTFENASFSAAILRQAGVEAALVVAHPWDMARALWSFRAVGYRVIPTAAPEGHSLRLSAAAFLPQIPALHDSYYALHELIGLAWYHLWYGN